MRTPATTRYCHRLGGLLLALSLACLPVRASLLITGIFEGVDDGGDPLQAIEIFSSSFLSSAVVPEYLVRVYQTNGSEPDPVADLVFDPVEIQADGFAYLTGPTLFDPIDPGAVVLNNDLYDFSGDPGTSFENSVYMYRLIHKVGEVETILDQFGLAPDVRVTTDPTTHDWDYFDRWLYRKDYTGPSGASFDLEEWVVRADEADPFPAGTYQAIPEPSLFGLLSLAGLLLLRFSRRR